MVLRESIIRGVSSSSGPNNILFHSGASRATGSPRRERTVRRRSAWTKGESVSFMSPALRSHGLVLCFFSITEVHALMLVKSFEPAWPHFMHSPSVHLSIHRPVLRPCLGSRYQDVMTGNRQHILLQDTITQHRRAINSHTAVQHVSYYLIVWCGPLIVPSGGHRNMPAQSGGWRDNRGK